MYLSPSKLGAGLLGLRHLPQTAAVLLLTGGRGPSMMTTVAESRVVCMQTSISSMLMKRYPARTSRLSFGGV
jgi:hypothetical protein